MIIVPHWDMKEYMHELSQDDSNPKAHRSARLAVLLQLMFRANQRLRCWPSTKTLCKSTGFNQPAVVEARNWIIAHHAVVLVPYEKRDGDEKKLPVRLNIYQLTGVLKLKQGVVPYLLMSPEMFATVTRELDVIGNEVSEVKTSVSEISVSEPKGITIPQGIPVKESPESKKGQRKPDPFFDAIAKVWGNNAGGWVGSMKSMFTGTATKGQWAQCKFDPPVTDAQEILDFEVYMLKRMKDKKLSEKPTACVTIQRWFYDFRNERDNPRNVISVLDGLRIVS